MDVSRICAELVAIKSENPPGDTSGVIEYIRNFLDTRGIVATVTDAGSGRCNLVTNGPKKPLLLCGHVDVVPALKDGWIHPPYSGVRKTDMSGAGVQPI